ncbi:MAG: amidohydrolase [Bryobacteraceae bacterium]
MSRLILLLFAVSLAAADKDSMVRKLDDLAPHYGQMSRQIWEWAEVGYKEKQSSALLRDELRKAGFRIEENIAGIPTAFAATWGSGSPVIGIMGEFDALPGLSQDSVPDKKARTAGAPGHGCGHNLFGVASMAAAISAKEFLEQNKLPGTVRFYGTPAEEGGAGKVFMARANAFRGVDAMITWHPGTRNQVSASSSLANINAKFQFHGLSAHAAAAPDKGRSALDGLLLMAHCVELMREHVPQETRIHYIITNGGGAPNVVPDFAEIYAYARHPQMPTLDGIWSRLVKCAEAGALGSGTKMDYTIVGSVYNLINNTELVGLLDRNLRKVGGYKYTPEEQAFAEKLTTSFVEKPADAISSHEMVQDIFRGDAGSGSTDVADVSWLVPTAQFTAATYVPGTPAHSWQSTACAGSTIGRKGMMVAAKTLALSLVDLLTEPKLVEAAKADFKKQLGGDVYKSRIPADAKPPLNYRDK